MIGLPLQGTRSGLQELLTDLGVPEKAVDVTASTLKFFLAFVALYFLGRIVVQPLVRRILESRDLDTHVRRPLLKLTNFALLFLAVAIAFGFAGFDSILTSLATIGAAATLAIGFAMQNVLSNFVSGVFIYTDRPFRTGDRIEWEDNSGFVEDIGLRVTRVRTFDNEHLTVPNSQLTDGVIKNYDHNRTLRLKFTFRIGLHDDIDAATTSSSRRPGGRRAS